MIRVAPIIEPRRVICSQLGRLEMHIRRRKRVLNALILTNRPAENDSLAGIIRRSLQRGIAQAEGLAGEETSLRVHAVQDDFETLPFFTDQGVCGDAVVVEEDLVGVDGAAAHFADFLDFETRGGFVEGDEEHAQTFAGFLDIF
jgi:hypothetical protein